MLCLPIETYGRIGLGGGNAVVNRACISRMSKDMTASRLLQTLNSKLHRAVLRVMADVGLLATFGAMYEDNPGCHWRAQVECSD